MLSKNMFEVPELDKVATFMDKKSKQVTPKRKTYANNIEIDIEHIKLENSKYREENETKKKIRPCCA